MTPYDIGRFNGDLMAALDRVSGIRGYDMRVLNVLDGEPLLLLVPTRINPDLPNLLVAAGFHGEEPAGPWGLVEFLTTCDPDLLRRANVSFLPLVNPTGFRVGNRYNMWGENPNYGCTDTAQAPANPSREIISLKNMLHEVLHLARDGFLTLHEDHRMDEAFLFIYNDDAEDAGFTACLRHVLAANFPMLAAAKLDEFAFTDAVWVPDGSPDCSFEAMLFKLGIPRCACTETPGQQPLDKRISTNAALVAAFIRHHLA